MNELQQCIEELNLIHNGDYYPRQQMDYIKEHKEASLPYLYDALDNAKDILQLKNDEDYLKHNLHIYAIYLLGEFKDKGAFIHIINAVSMSEKSIVTLYGDIITNDLADILYETYDENKELLKEKIANSSISVYVRFAMLKTYLQLYKDGNITKEETMDFLHQLIYTSSGDKLKDYVAFFICRCHFIEMLDDIKYLKDKHFIDKKFCGDYDNLIDIMFNYEKENFCNPPIDTYQRINRWSLFDKDPQVQKTKKELQKKELDEKRLDNQNKKKIKVGRNDPCPCGSGKKYKKCCMNKDINNQKDTNAEALRYYPQLRETNDNRIYINDYYDEESIEIDKLLYLALKHQRHRTIRKYNKNIHKDQVKRKTYLLEAFDKYVIKYEKENLTSNTEYDAKYSIHYTTKQWLKKLLDLLDNDDRYDEVYSYYIK